jgi:hypothetical protein
MLPLARREILPPAPESLASEGDAEMQTAGRDYETAESIEQGARSRKWKRMIGESEPRKEDYKTTDYETTESPTSDNKITDNSRGGPRVQ